MSELEEMNALVDASVLLFADIIRLSRIDKRAMLSILELVRLCQCYKRRGQKSRDLAA